MDGLVVTLNPCSSTGLGRLRRRSPVHGAPLGGYGGAKRLTASPCGELLGSSCAVRSHPASGSHPSGAIDPCVSLVSIMQYSIQRFGFHLIVYFISISPKIFRPRNLLPLAGDR